MSFWDGCIGVVSDVDQSFRCLRFPPSSTVSKLPSVLAATEEEIQLLLAAQCHIGAKNCDKQMQPYVWKRRSDGEEIAYSHRALASQPHSC